MNAKMESRLVLRLNCISLMPALRLVITYRQKRLIRCASIFEIQIEHVYFMCTPHRYSAEI